MISSQRAVLRGLAAAVAAGALASACGSSGHHRAAPHQVRSKPAGQSSSSSAVGAAGTGGGGSSTTSGSSATHPSPSTSEITRAAAINLGPSDFPSGWEAHPSGASITTQSTVQRCGTAPTASVTVPTLSSAWVFVPKPTLGKSAPSVGLPLEALSGVSFAPSAADASSYAAYSRSAQATSCVTAAISTILRSSGVTTSSAPTLTASTSTTSILGTTVTLIRVSVAGTGTTPTFVLAYFAKGTVLVSAELVDFTTAQQSLQSKLLTGLVRRA